MLPSSSCTVLPSLLVPSSVTTSLTREAKACIFFRCKEDAFLNCLVILQNLPQMTKRLVYSTTADSIRQVHLLYSICSQSKKKIYIYLVTLVACFGMIQLTTLKYGALRGPVRFGIFHTAQKAKQGSKFTFQRYVQSSHTEFDRNRTKNVESKVTPLTGYEDTEEEQRYTSTFFILILCFRASQYKTNETPT